MIKSYGLSMMHGHQHTSQSLPRMLTLWFEFGTFLQAFRSAAKLTVGEGLGRGGREVAEAGPRRLLIRHCQPSPVPPSLLFVPITHSPAPPPPCRPPAPTRSGAWRQPPPR